MSPKDLAPALLVVSASIVPFARCMPNAWLWDDRVLLGQRLAPDKCGGLGDIWRQPYWGEEPGLPGAYRPLSLSLMYLEKRAFGDSVFPYHVVSLGLHALVSLLVMGVVGRLAGASIGWVCALLFAVHPVHAEAVAMVYGQLELVAAIFVLLTVWFYVQSRTEGVCLATFALAVVCAFCAAFSKESALMLPALLMLVRAAWMGGDSAEGRIRPFARGIGWDGLFLLAIVPYLLLRYRALGSLAPDPETTVTMDFGLGTRLKIVIICTGHALRLCTVPTGQSVYYGHLRDSVFGRPYNELLWMVIGAIVLGWLVLEIGRRRVLFGAGWFLLRFFPVSNVVPTGVLVAERTLYLPSLAVCFLVAALVDRLSGEGVDSPKVARGAVAGLVVVYGVASSMVVGSWRSEETLWRSTVSAHPRSPLGQLLLGQAIVNRVQSSGSQPAPGELREAFAAFETAYQLNPQLAQALVGGGVVSAMQGDLDGAERLLRQALQAAPNDPAAREALRAVLERTRTGEGNGNDWH